MADRLDAQLVALRALCELVATGGPTIRGGSISVSLGSDGAGAALLRTADRVAAEFDVDERIGLDGGRGVVRVSRPQHRLNIDTFSID